MAKLKFVVEFQVDESWVADGFNPDDDRAKSMLAHSLPYADGSELKARVLIPIDQKKAAKLMGYASLGDMVKERKKAGEQDLTKLERRSAKELRLPAKSKGKVPRCRVCDGELDKGKCHNVH